MVTLGCALAVAAQAPIPDQYPKPLIHTAANHPASHILLISVDGLRALDLAEWVNAHPHSALAELSARGVTYSNAHTPWADPAAGLLSLTTGGTPISTGILSTNGYDRALSPAGSQCTAPGAAFRLDGSYSLAMQPRDPHHGCTPVAPHKLVRVNTMFEVVHEKIGPTAWAGENPASTDLLRGPSGNGIDDDASSCLLPPTSDARRLAAVHQWIDGRDCAGKPASVPVLFGLSLANTDIAQLDAAVAGLMQELRAQDLYDTTWIVVTAPYGHETAMPRRIIPLERLAGAAKTAHIAGGRTALIWLRDPATTQAAVKSYAQDAHALRIARIHSGTELALTLNATADDSRMPDIILEAEDGVVWGNEPVHGGMSDDETHVALLISGAQLSGRTDKTPVPTTQLAPLLLRALGMEKFDLNALHQEHSPALPGIF